MFKSKDQTLNCQRLQKAMERGVLLMYSGLQFLFTTLNSNISRTKLILNNKTNNIVKYVIFLLTWIDEKHALFR